MNVVRSMTAAATAIVLGGLGAFAKPETLILRTLDGAKTIEVEINYDKYPKVALPPGWPPGTQWSDLERDTSWYDSGMWGYGPVLRVQFNHPFRARFQGVEGAGFDYIDYEGMGRGNDHYHGMFGFEFQVDSLDHFLLVDGAHYRENAKIPVPNTLFAPGSPYQMDDFISRFPVWGFVGIETYRMYDRLSDWGNGPADPDAGADAAQGKNGKAGALPPWLLFRKHLPK